MNNDSPTPSTILEPLENIPAVEPEQAAARLAPLPDSEMGADLRPRAKPVLGSERRIALDVLRGVAIYGILFVNIESFSMITAARRNPVFGGGEGDLNYAIWLLTMLLADTKFIALFGMLFGGGAVIMIKRWVQAGRQPLLLYYRRMIVLAGLGLLHGFYLWDGDILFYYGVYGCLIFPLALLPGHWLFGLGIAGIFANGILIGWPYIPHHRGAGMYEIYYLTKDFTHQLEWRQEEARRTYEIVVKQFAMQGIGFMAIGMALVKGGVITGHRRPWSYLLMAVAGFALGIPISGYLTDWCKDFDGYRGAMFVLGSLLVTFGWMGASVALACYTPNFFFTRGLANVGRMALSNYLGQTLICTYIFYGHGLGQFNQWDRTQQLMLVFAICTAQMILSSLWLSVFRFGPFEYVWRTLTYLRPQPVFQSRVIQALRGPFP